MCEYYLLTSQNNKSYEFVKKNNLIVTQYIKWEENNQKSCGLTLIEYHFDSTIDLNR